jgi:hypothetical protein
MAPRKDAKGRPSPRKGAPQLQTTAAAETIVAPQPGERKGDVVEIALSDIGLSTAPNRQIRAIDMAHVRHLIEETDPTEWDPIQVRPWPETDPYPQGEEGRPCQVISGYHRTTAARGMPDMTSIRAQVVDAPDDATFLLIALKGNLRHGKLMSTDEQRAAVVRLHALGMSLGDIRRETSISKGTIHNWLSKRDTNAGRLLRMQQADAEKADTRGEDDLAAEWRVMPTADLDAKRLRQVGSGLHDLLARTYDPADVLAWAGA